MLTKDLFGQGVKRNSTDNFTVNLTAARATWIYLFRVKRGELQHDIFLAMPSSPKRREEFPRMKDSVVVWFLFYSG